MASGTSLCPISLFDPKLFPHHFHHLDLQQIIQTDGAKHFSKQNKFKQNKFMSIKTPTNSGVAAYMELALEFSLKMIPHTEPSIQIYLGT